MASDSDASSMSDAETQSLKKVELDGDPEINEVDVEFAEYPDDCFCSVFKRKIKCCRTIEDTTIGRIWWDWRCKAYKLTQHKYFETFIITMILTSSLALVSMEKFKTSSFEISTRVNLSFYVMNFYYVKIKTRLFKKKETRLFTFDIYVVQHIRAARVIQLGLIVLFFLLSGIRRCLLGRQTIAGDYS